MAASSFRFRLAALVVLAASAVFISLAPPAPARLDISGWDDLASRTISGAYHIHSTRSDGHGDRAAIASAAKRAGLQFVILTDHGDGTRPPDPPSYVGGVLVLDGVEISSDDGHYVAIDMPRAPYPLGGSGESVVEDVRRLGGFGIVAHPDSPKASLRWSSSALPDGIEWLNFDSEWRDETRMRLLRATTAYFIRPGPALTMVLDRPPTLDARWPALLAAGPSVALAASDAHGGVGRRSEDASRNFAGSIGIPSYAASFSAFTNRVILERPLSGDAATDARAIHGAIRGGRVFSAITGRAAPALLDFSVEAAQSRGVMGAVLGADSDATLIARAPLPDGSEMSILRNGQVMTTARGGEVRYVVTGGTGAYRVEILATGGYGVPPIPWVVSNAIYFGAGGRDVRAGTGSVAVEASVNANRAAPFPWRIEKDPSSSGMLRTTQTEAVLEFKLGEGARANQFVALASDLRQQTFGVIELSLAADRAMRVSVQLRSADGERWGRSYYVDPSGSSVRVPVAALQRIGAAGQSGQSHVDSTRATSLLLVVDLTNANPGRTGKLTVRASAFVR